MATVGNVGATGNADIDGLLSGVKWVGTVTYSFTDSASDYETGYGSGEPTATGFAQISAAQQTAVNRILSLVESYTNLDFSYAGTNGADMRFAQSSAANPTAFAYYPWEVEGGDVWFGTNYSYRTPALGNYSYLTHIHEIGHALGLKHSHETEGVANVAVPSAHDSMEWTVMSYRAYVGAPLTGYTNEAFGFATTFMRNDIRALQEMYGADFTTESGDTVYSWSPTTGEFFIDGVGQGRPGGPAAGTAANVVFMTVWDGGGVDTYDLSAYTTGVTIDLSPGGASKLAATQLASLGSGHIASGSVYNAFLYQDDARSYIENVIGGSAGDTLTGNAIANRLDGRGGADILTGGAGTDTFVFGLGYGADIITDFSVIGGDIVDISSLTGFDSLDDVVGAGAQSGANAVITFNIGLTLTFQNVSLAALTADDFVFAGPPVNYAPSSISLTKSTIAENVSGGTVGNVIVGDPNGDTEFTFAVSDDRFEVSGAPGSYSLVLKPGEALDFEAAQSVTLSITATDTGGLAVTKAITIAVTNAAGVTASGGTGNDTFNGTGEADVYNGLSGDDVINGLGDSDNLQGGLGNDTLDGGDGNDILQGGAGADIITGGAGIDTASYSLSTVAVTVNLTLSGAQVGTGDALGDTLSGIENVVGSAKNDTITGDADDNVLEGGLGNDVLSGGTHSTGGDTVSYAGAAALVKVSLMLTGAQATGGGGVDTLTGFENVIGSKFADTIEGSAGANRLDGGAGTDTLSYVRDTAGIMMDLRGTVGSGGHAQGDMAVAFENLIAGSGNDVLGGSKTNNMIDGGAGDDTISGFGGLDILKGGLGIDTVDFDYSAVGVTVSLAKTAAQVAATGHSVTLTGFENLSGSAHADKLTGDLKANAIFGNGGDDVIAGGGGADTLDGGAQALMGDTVSYVGSLAGVTVDLGLGAAAQVSAGDASGDKLSGFENILGSSLADVLTGDTGDNILEGGLGNDTLVGGDGLDTASYAGATAAVKVSLALSGAQATGGGGTDTLLGIENLAGSKLADTLTGDGADNLIRGGAGLDILTGGGGADTFDFAALADKGDRITDFQAGSDVIQLHAAGFSGSTAGTVKFASGSNPGSGAGSGWLLYDTDDGKLYYDPDGTGAALKQLLVTLTGAPALTADDIVVV